MSQVDPTTESGNHSTLYLTTAANHSSFLLTTPSELLNTTSQHDAIDCQATREYGIVFSIIAVVSTIFGILYTFFGYRFFKAIMFLTGFIFGTVLVYMVMSEVAILPPEGTLGCAGGSGFLLGFVTMLIPHTGLFLTGFNLGIAATAVILIFVEQFVHINIMWIPIGIFLVIGTVFGVLSLKFQKTLTIIGTSVFGAAICLAGIDHFIEWSFIAQYIWDRIMAKPASTLCWYSWLMLALWPVCALCGVVVQWKFTGSGVDHWLALKSRREQGANLQQVRAREKKETQQTRYRHLYQARRVKGDVISQNFIQSIQHKLSPAMQSLTALNVEASNEEESTATTTLTNVT
ncbi:transmembrane protein 198-like [Physella acuta]|uniref:transmembrane protein 198-like n=1 Tax=Physella acuta TaxID=109671 RepID=UPI0027DC186F|nr:transmembrane protein 198-like [Physella acuta]